jgi:hypothetical protein
LVGWPVARDDAGVADEIESPMNEAQVPDPAPDAEVQRPESTVDADAEPAEPVAEDGVSTGHAGIDAALRRLDELDGMPVEQHGEVFDELHGQLRDALTAAATPAPESSDD